MSQLDALYAEAQAFLQHVRAASLKAQDGQPVDVKELSRHARRLQDHLDGLKGLTNQ